jgi:hypothetical protein
MRPTDSAAVTVIGKVSLRDLRAFLDKIKPVDDGKSKLKVAVQVFPEGKEYRQSDGGSPRLNRPSQFYGNCANASS